MSDVQKTNENIENNEANNADTEALAFISEGIESKLADKGIKLEAKTEQDAPGEGKKQEPQGGSEKQASIFELTEDKSYSIGGKEYDHERISTLIQQGEELESKAKFINESVELANEYNDLLENIESDPKTVLANLVKEYGKGEVVLVDAEGEEIEPKTLDDDAKKIIEQKDKEIEELKTSHSHQEQTAKAIKEIDEVYSKLNNGEKLNWEEAKNDPLHPVRLAGQIRVAATEKQKTDESIKVPTFENALKQVMEKLGKKEIESKPKDESSHEEVEPNKPKRKIPGMPEGDSDPEVKKISNMMKDALQKKGIIL